MKVILIFEQSRWTFPTKMSRSRKKGRTLKFSFSAVPLAYARVNRKFNYNDGKLSFPGCFFELVEKSKSRITMNIQSPSVVKPRKRARWASIFQSFFLYRFRIQVEKSKSVGSMKLYAYQLLQKKRVASRIMHARKMWSRRFTGEVFLIAMSIVQLILRKTYRVRLNSLTYLEHS